MSCSGDLHSIVDCNNNVVMQCAGTDACDASTFSCTNACQAAATNKRSVGCDYYATSMDVLEPGYCFAAYVANTWNAPVHIGVKYQGADQPVANFVRIPQGSGPGLTYGNYDATAGLAPGQVAILFLGGNTGAAPLCPIASAIPASYITGTGLGASFEITTDVPVVAYEINPYGGGSAAVTAGSLLIPTSAWDLDYVAVNVTPTGIAGSPSLNVIAQEDGTLVTVTPNKAIVGGNGVPAATAGTPMNVTLNKGQHLQITQNDELTGSGISGSKPIGVMAGQPCMNMPTSTAYCDHGEQMVPPIHALGSHYVGVMYRPRNGAETSTFWKVVGVADGTQLTWSTPVGGPATLAKGQSVDFQTGTPFVVSSQDKDHPFMLFTYMTGSEFIASGGTGFGDPDFVLGVPPEQYLTDYVFFADPTYPETNLVVVRSRGGDGQFHDVNLDCLGPITTFAPIGGNVDFEFARVDLMTGNFTPVGNCSTGRREIKSDAPFGLWVWGWGTEQTSSFTANVSYGYPGGMNVQPINNVIF
jgi:IgGFc binding protein